MFGLNKYAIYAIIAIVIVGIVTSFIYGWQQSIRNTALLEFNNKQLQQLAKDNELFLSRLKNIEGLQEQTIETMKQKNEELNLRLGSLEQYLDTDQAQKDSRESSEVLKNTIKGLRR